MLTLVLKKAFAAFRPAVFLCVYAWFLPSLNARALAEAAIISVAPPEDTNAVLHNPDMGWVVYENYPLDRDPHGSSTMLTLPNDDFPEAEAVALMFSWQDIETREGVYDFSSADRAYDYWHKRGKEIQLRVSSESLVWWSKRNPPAGKGVPDYVLPNLSAEEKQTRAMEGETYVVVDARSPFYQERLSAFLRAVNKHFRDLRPVTLIDLRGFGVWGEWHSGFHYPNLQARRDALKSVLNLWSEAFPLHMLALSYSYDPDSPKKFYAGPNNRYDSSFTTNYHDFLNFSAFDHALTKTNITFRRDGCGGAVHSNERRLNEEAFSKYRCAPMVSEFLGSYSAAKNGGSNWVNWMVEDALSLHPNYVALMGWQGADARSFARERPDLIAYGLRHMGYRLLPTRVQYPAVITNNAPFQIRFDWVNRGTGRALRDYQMELLLEDHDGATVAQTNLFTLLTSKWMLGETYATSHAAKFSNRLAGDYHLAFLIRDPVTKKAIALPLRDKTSQGGYSIGNIRLASNLHRD